MKKLLTLLLTRVLIAGIIGLAVMPHAFAATELARSGKTSYVISLAADAIPAEKTAAEELQKYLQQVTGATFAVHPETVVRSGAPQILVGAGTRVKGLLPRQDWEALGQDGIVIRTTGNSLILAGGRSRGSLYAVYQFLEDSVGCRWWTPSESTIPRKTTLKIEAQNVTYRPPFDWREHYTSSVRDDDFFATRMRENGQYQGQGPMLGGHNTMLWWCHTTLNLVPLDTYFEKHPEWFADPANGNKPCTATSKKPYWLVTQLCLSNAEVLAELTKNAIKLIDTDPTAGYISISQMEGDNFCRCPECARKVAEEGSQSGPFLDMVNKVAAGIHEKYPDILVETLAYNSTETPPKTIRPAKNVIIRMAPIWSDNGHAINSEWNKKTRDNLLGWSKIAPRLFVWNYVANFDALMLTHPNWDNLATNFRFFAAHNVKGIFTQGDIETNNVGDFTQLRTWLMSKLLWNPNNDQDKIVTEFLNGYYGAAGPYLKKHIDSIQESFRSRDRVLSTYNRDFTFLTLDVANRSIRLLDQAEAAVRDDKTLLSRVQRERLSFTLTLFYRYNALKRTAEREGKEFLGPKDPLTALDEFHKAAVAYGIGAGADMKNQIPRLQELLAPPVPLPEFAKAYPLDDVIDLQPRGYILNNENNVRTVIEDDPTASGGNAAVVMGNSHDWDIQAPAGRSLDNFNDEWRVYAVVRMAGKTDPSLQAQPREPIPNQEQPKPEMAFQLGVYDLFSHSSVLNDKGQDVVGVPIDRMKTEGYQVINMGTYKMATAETYIYVQPLHHPAVNKIYVDRLLLIREKKKTP